MAITIVQRNKSKGVLTWYARVPDPSIAPWIMEYIDELTKFPNATHDDQVDATTQGLSQTWHRKSLWDLI